MALSDDDILGGLTAGVSDEEILKQLGSGTSGTESSVRGFSQGATFGFGDEINASVVASRKALTRKLVEKLYGSLPEEAKSTFAADYSAERDKERSKNTQASEDNPWTYGLSEAGAGMTQGFAGLSKALGKEVGKQTLRQAAPKLAGIGAAEGGLYGLGTSEGETVGEVAKDTATAAGVGAIGAVAIPGGAQALGRTYQRLVKTKGQKAANLVISDLQKAGYTPEEAIKYLDDNPEMIVGDLGKNLQWHTGAVATSPGQGAEDISELLVQRNLDQLDDRIEPFFVRTLGGNPNEGIGKTLEASQNQLSEIARPLYKQAYDTPIQLNDEINSVLNTPAGKQALELAQEKAANNNVAAGPATSTRTLDYVARSLNDMAEGAKGKLGQATDKSSDMYALRRKLLEEVRGQNPAFKQAQAIYSDEKSIQDAFTEGTKALNGNALNKVDTINDMPKAEKVAMRSGLFQAVLQKVGSSPDSGDASRIFKRPNIRKVLNAAFDDPKDFEEFERLIEKEATMAQTMRPLNNSVTAPLSTFGEGLSDVATELITSGGDPAHALGRFVAKKGMDFKGEQFRNELAPLLSAGKNDDLMSLLLQKSERKPYQVTESLSKLVGQN